MTHWSNLTRILVVLGLAFGLGMVLYVRHLVNNDEDATRLEDRLPAADYMIKTDLLDVAKETSALLFANKIKFRDFVSHEFLLGQGKSFGLDLQSTTYIFANETGEWGSLVAVNDSSKIKEGIAFLRQSIPVRDTLVDDRLTYYWPEENAFVSYDRNWLFVYKGTNFERHLKKISRAEKGDIVKEWKVFLDRKEFRKQKLVLSAKNKQLSELGIERALFAHDNDSTSFTVLTYFKSTEPWAFKRKEKGKSLQYNAYTNMYLNLHMDVSEFRNATDSPFYKLLSKLSRRISFPFKEFMKAWEGDISFVQGGFQMVTETYIETEMDDDFNLQEVKKTREVKVPGFSLAVSLNKNANRFLERLKEKGILTQEDNENKYRFLFSPPLNYLVQGQYHTFYSADYAPGLSDDNLNNGLWNEEGTKFNFQLDSLNPNEAFGKLKFPVEKLIQKNKFL